MKNTGREKMKNLRVSLKVLMTLSMLAMVIVGCEEDPESIYDPDITGNATPVVTTVAPDSNYSANNTIFSGIGVVQITGENFSTVPAYNNVYFGGEPGFVMNSTETTLRVRVPNIEGDSLIVQVAVRGAFDFGQYALPVVFTPAVSEIGGFDDLDQLYSLACDETETLWITAFGVPRIQVIAVQPDSLKENIFQSLTVSSTSLTYGGQNRLVMTGGALLYAMGRESHSIDASVMFPIAGSDVTLDMDFVDSTLAFMAIKKTPNYGYILSVDLDGANLDTAAAYDTLGIAAVRVFNEELYVAGSYQVDAVNLASAVWKNAISGSTLGQRELVVDLGDYPEYAGVQITSMTFSDDGKLYLGLNSVDAIVVYDNGILTPFYAPVLSPPTKDLTWGNGDFLYQLKTTRLVKIDMVKDGAPYGGRY